MKDWINYPRKDHVTRQAIQKNILLKDRLITIVGEEAFRARNSEVPSIPRNSADFGYSTETIAYRGSIYREVCSAQRSSSCIIRSRSKCFTHMLYEVESRLVSGSFLFDFIAQQFENWN